MEDLENALSSVVLKLPQVETYCFCMSLWQGAKAAMIYYMTMGFLSAFNIYIFLDYAHKAETIMKYFQLPFLYSSAVVGAVLCLLGLAIILSLNNLAKVLPLLFVVCGYIHGILFFVWWLLAFVRAFIAPGIMNIRDYANNTEIIIQKPLWEALFTAAFILVTPFGFYSLISFNSYYNAGVYTDEEE